jgi:hypothetical protein
MHTIIYNCKKCKKGRRAEYPIEKEKGYFYRTNADGLNVPAGVWTNASMFDSFAGKRVYEYGGDTEKGLCPSCGRAMDYGILAGRVNPDHKCNGVCVNARGPQCDCSCGGANHGKGWGA